MRIALFTDSYPPRIDGIARFSQLERLELEKQGHEVLVICPRRGRITYEDDDHILALPSFKALVYEGLYAAHARRADIKRIEAFAPEAIRINSQINVGFIGLRYGRKHKLPIVNTYWSDFDLVDEYLAFLLGALCLPSFLWLYTGHRSSWRNFRQAWRSRKISRRKLLSRWLITQFGNACNASIAPTRKIANQIKAYATTPVEVISFGAEEVPEANTESGQKFREHYHIDTDAFVVTSTPRLVKEKRVDMVIAAFALTQSQNPDRKLHLVIAGDGPEASQLRRQAQKLGVEEQVTFTGSLSGLEIRKLLQASDVFVNASLRETFALSACEAALAEVPLIMCDATLEGVFVPDKTGLLCDTPADIAAAITKLATDKGLARRVGTAGREKALEFTPHQAVKNTVALIEKTQSSIGFTTEKAN